MKKKILEEILKRYSPRKFKDTKIEQEKIDLILEAARWAPSGFNNQPWRYAVIKKSSNNFEKMIKSLMPGNGWAKSAPLLIVAYTNKKFQKSANNIAYHIYDTSLSVMSLCIEAEHQGLKTHQMGGFFAKKVKKVLGLDDDFDVCVVIAIGYEDKKLGRMQKITDGVRNKVFKPRTRKKVSEIVEYF